MAVNARDAMPAGGTLTILTEDVPCGDPAEDGAVGGATGCVRLSVSDTGTGMDEATRARIFDPFFTTKEREHGTGLGLSTVSGIVDQSGGSVEVRSTPCQGATFVITSPHCSPEAEIEDPGTVLLQKPFGPDELMATVGALLAS